MCWTKHILNSPRYEYLKLTSERKEQHPKRKPKENYSYDVFEPLRFAKALLSATNCLSLMVMCLELK